MGRGKVLFFKFGHFFSHFSASFEQINTQAKVIWQYHLYDLVYEYYYLSWLPIPLNLFCHLTNIIIWIAKRIHKLCICMSRAKRAPSAQQMDYYTEHSNHFCKKKLVLKYTHVNVIRSKCKHGKLLNLNSRSFYFQGNQNSYEMII